ncbi:hypothetical protein E2320_013310, partial [Naja naja]
DQLNTYQEITSDKNLFCKRCNNEAEFWCTECVEFLCLNCKKAHEWYLKQKSHEIQQLADLKKETAQNVFSETGVLVLHSIYCRGCHKALCCSCALLDGQHYHAQLYSDIRVEIENRKEELSRLKEELLEKKRTYESSHNNVHEQLKKLEKVQSETHELIQKKVEDMVQWIQQKGKKLMEKVNQQLCQEQEEAKKKLARAEQILKRMDAAEQLVEKMHHFAADQEVIDMHPFIKESLEGLKKEKLTVSSFQIEVENFDEVQGEIQALLKRVKGEGACGCTISTPGSHSSMVNSTTSIISPIKRPIAQLEKSIQASPKMLKLEERECDASEVSNQQDQENVPRSGESSFCESTPEPEQKEPAGSLVLREDCPSGICESVIQEKFMYFIEPFGSSEKQIDKLTEFWVKVKIVFFKSEELLTASLG